VVKSGQPYVLGTVPACVLACVEVCIIYYLVLFCALTFAHIVGLVGLSQVEFS
jgi:hypothetical protein